MERLIQIRATITADHRLVATMPPDIPPGEYEIRLNIPHSDTEDARLGRKRMWTGILIPITLDSES